MTHVWIEDVPGLTLDVHGRPRTRVSFRFVSGSDRASGGRRGVSRRHLELGSWSDRETGAAVGQHSDAHSTQSRDAVFLDGLVLSVGTVSSLSVDTRFAGKIFRGWDNLAFRRFHCFSSDYTSSQGHFMGWIYRCARNKAMKTSHHMNK